MLLKIILVIVFVKMLMDYLCIKEGLLDISPTLNEIGNKSTDTCNVNIKLPNYDIATGTYNNNNNFIVNNFSNIEKSANPSICV
jgi:hypothetical protein